MLADRNKENLNKSSNTGLVGKYCSCFQGEVIEYEGVWG